MGHGEGDVYPPPPQQFSLTINCIVKSANNYVPRKLYTVMQWCGPFVKPHMEGNGHTTVSATMSVMMLGCRFASYKTWRE